MRLLTCKQTESQALWPFKIFWKKKQPLYEVASLVISTFRVPKNWEQKAHKIEKSEWLVKNEQKMLKSLRQMGLGLSNSQCKSCSNAHVSPTVD